MMSEIQTKKLLKVLEELRDDEVYNTYWVGAVGAVKKILEIR